MSAQLLYFVNPLISTLENLQRPFSQLADFQREYDARLSSQRNSLTDMGGNKGFVGAGANEFTTIVQAYCSQSDKIMNLVDLAGKTMSVCANEVLSATDRAMAANLDEGIVSHILGRLTLDAIVRSGDSEIHGIVEGMRYTLQDLLNSGGNFFGHIIHVNVGGAVNDIEQVIERERLNFELDRIEQVLSEWAQSIHVAVGNSEREIRSLTEQIGSGSYSIAGVTELVTSLNTIEEKANTHPFPSTPSYDPNIKAFDYGQCTWWADERFHQIYGRYVPWTANSNAYQWKMQAKNNNWNISETPTVGSIIVLQPGTQGVDKTDGHVAFVEQVLPNGDIITSNMNVPPQTNQVSKLIFHPGNGVSFISPPASWFTGS